MSVKSPNVFKITFIILISFVIMMPAFAGTFYVRTDGNDSNSGLENTPSGAWATIQKAADTLNPGDTAEIQSGTYNEAVTITTSGTSDRYIVFRASGQVIIDAQGKEGSPIKINGANYIRLEGLTCKSAAAAGILLVNANNNILVRNVSSSLDGNGIETDTASSDNQLIGNITSQGTSTNTINTIASELPVSGPSQNIGLPPYISSSSSNEAKFAPDEIIVKFKKGSKITPSTSAVNIAVTGLSSVDTIHKKLKVTSMSKLFKGGRPKIMKLRRTAIPAKEPPDLTNIYKLKIGKNASVSEAVEIYRQDPNVEYAEPNYIFKICLLPNDPYYYSSGSWGQPYQDLWGLYKIQASSAWDIKRGEDIVVAVIDTGLDYDHADIDQNVWVNIAETNGTAGIDDDANGYIDDIRGYDFYNNDADPIDDHGHGTHVSGTIAAEGNNNIGVIGVAYNSTIMSLKGFDADGSGYEFDLAEALVYAANNGADILNNSWGGLGTSQTIEDAVNYAHSLGCIVVAAAGNDNSDVSDYCPANIANVIAVSAFDDNDVIASFSNYGSKIDVAAPGMEILSLRAQGTDMYGDGIHIVGQSYYWAEGTSMACPHLAGVAALILSNHPTFTNEEVRHVLRVSADDVDQPGWDINSGYGRINAYMALLVDNPAEAKITLPHKLQYVNKQVEITGIIGEQFDEWRLYYASVEDPLNETLIQSGVVNEPDYLWDTTCIPYGNYYIKLKVFNQGSLSAVDIVEITIDHHIQWVAMYNGGENGGENYSDSATAIALDTSGNVYVTGTSGYGQGYYDYATVKYDTNGNQLWVRRYNEGLYDKANAIAVDTSGNVYVTGSGYATIKYDTNGDQLWLRRYNGPGNSSDTAYAIAVDTSGNVYVTGESTGLGTSYDYATIKYDTNGNQLWVARYNGPANSYDDAYAIALDTSGNVYVTGSSRYDWGTAGNDYTTVKYDTNGNQLWVRRYNGGNNYVDNARAMALDTSGNVYVTGTSGYGQGYYDYATVKYDTNGNQLWVRRYNGGENHSNTASAIALDASGNVYVTGQGGVITPERWYTDYATVKYDTNGNQLWASRYNGPGNDGDNAYAIALDASGNVYVTGGSYSTILGHRYPNYATVKYDTNGNQLWASRYNGPGNYSDTASAIALDASGNVYVTGGSSGGDTNGDYATIKYYQSQDGEIEGKITLQSRSNHSASIIFELRDPGETTSIESYNVMTDNQGNFNLINVAAGTYDLTAKGSNFLRAKQSNIVVQEGQATPNVNFHLLGGDANGDNSIGLGDMVIVKSAWLTKAGDTKWDWRADFNNDYSIGMGDLIILKNNWLKHGDD